jgi:hypothetical protein
MTRKPACTDLPGPTDESQVRELYKIIFSAFDTLELSFGQVLRDGLCAIRFTVSGPGTSRSSRACRDRDDDHAAGIIILRRPGYRAALTGRHAATANPAGSGAGARMNLSRRR